jgi:hypothetical protein
MKFEKEILSEFGEAVVNDLRQSISFSGISASGNLEQSIRYELSETALTVFGASYAFAAEFGRGPTQKSGGDLRAAIRRWIDDKGIIPDGITKDSLAFVITRSIHNKGTRLFDGSRPDFYGRTKPTEILNGVINDGRVNELEQQLAIKTVTAIRNTLNNENT